jgi:hypothetical protein
VASKGVDEWKQKEIVYGGEMKGISFYGGQAGDLDFPYWNVYTHGYFLKERKKKKSFRWRA